MWCSDTVKVSVASINELSKYSKIMHTHETHAVSNRVFSSFMYVVKDE